MDVSVLNELCIHLSPILPAVKLQMPRTFNTGF